MGELCKYVDVCISNEEDANDVFGIKSEVAAVLLLCVPLIPVSIVAVQKFAKKLLAKYWGTFSFSLIKRELVLQRTAVTLSLRD